MALKVPLKLWMKVSSAFSIFVTTFGNFLFNLLKTAPCLFLIALVVKTQKHVTFVSTRVSLELMDYKKRLQRKCHERCKRNASLILTKCKYFIVIHISH